jgi:hypothetical protein
MALSSPQLISHILLLLEG